MEGSYEKERVVNYQNLDVEKISAGEVAETTMDKGKYYTAEVLYDYGEGNLDVLCVELPEMTTRSGITHFTEEKQGKEDKKYTKHTYSALFKLDLNNEDHIQAAEVLDKVYKKCCHLLVSAFKSKAGKLLMGFDPNVGSSDFTSPIKWDLNSDLDKIPGRSPALAMKLERFGKQKTTLFLPNETGSDDILDYKQWDSFKRVEMTMVPVLRFADMFVGSVGKYLRRNMKSAIITNLNTNPSNMTQSSTRQRLYSERPDMGEKIRQQMELISAKKLELDSSTKVPSPTQTFGDQPNDSSSPKHDTLDALSEYMSSKLEIPQGSN